MGYLVEHPDGLLMDTGMGTHPEVDAYSRPRRRSLPTALSDAGARVEDVALVVNCHLHFDHGGRPPTTARPPEHDPARRAGGRARHRLPAA